MTTKAQMKLFTENFGGNLHETAHSINTLCPEIIPDIVTMDSSGRNTVVVYRAKKKPKVLERNTQLFTQDVPFG